MGTPRGAGGMNENSNLPISLQYFTCNIENSKHCFSDLLYKSNWNLSLGARLRTPQLRVQVGYERTSWKIKSLL